MSQEMLERALNKTIEREEKSKKAERAAMVAGKVLGAAAALSLDATLVWLVLTYLVSFPVSWVTALGWTLLAYLVAAKFHK